MEKKRLKILEVVTVPTEKSGIPNVAFNLMRAFPPEEVELGYVSINEPSDFYKKQLDELGARLYVIPRKLSSPWTYVAKLAKIAKGYDIIHVHGNSATMVLEMLAGRLAGVRIRAAHSHNTSCRMKTIDRLMRPLFYALCNCRLACGQEAGNWLFGERDFNVIRNGIESSRFRYEESKGSAIRSRLGIEKGFLIGNIANFLEAKNHQFLIDVMSCLANRREDIKLILLGDGELKSAIEERVKKEGLEDKVILVGSVSNPEDYMSAMDLIVMPSIYEGLPLTLIEEQANGLSALVSDAVTEEANLTGNIIYLSLDMTPDQWADKIETLLANTKHDSETSDSSISKIKQKGYDISSSARSLLDIFHAGV